MIIPLHHGLPWQSKKWWWVCKFLIIGCKNKGK